MVRTLCVGGVHHGRDRVNNMCYPCAASGAGRAAPIPPQVFEISIPAPQLLAILCLMRDEDWTFREAEVRLAEHTELRTALGRRHMPDSTILYRFLRRLDEAGLEQILSAAVHRLVSSPARQAMVAVDATGLAPGAISTFFVKRAQDRGEGVSGATGSHRPWSWMSTGN